MSGIRFHCRHRWLSAGLVCTALAVQLSADEVEVTDAISREISIFNDLSGTPEASDSISREVSIFNDLVGDEFFATDAVGRELSTFNDLTGPEFAINDAIGREISTFNDLVESEIVATDAISREFSVQTGTLTVTITSAGIAHAHAVEGALRTQLDRLNQAPPAYDQKNWILAYRHLDLHERTQFRCERIGLESISGAVEAIDPPESCEADVLESSSVARIFAEQRDITLAKDLRVSLTEPGAYDDASDLPSGGRLLKAGSRIDSHFVHFDTSGSDDHTRSGSVSFDSDILGVIVIASQQNTADLVVGWPDTYYPTGDSRRGLEMDTEDALELSADRRTLSFTLQNAAGLDQIRIITAVPDLLAEAHVDAEQYLDDADEVTLDNCQSAFYRFTFQLPAEFTVATLLGQANVDDQAVVYLNGTRISALLQNPGCEPDPLDPDDPCWAKQDAGHDRIDDDGRAVLTWPTLDEFGTEDVKLFKPGENELVFAVCGAAAPWKPTGVEFVATISIDATILLGDLNCDGSVDFADIDPFVLVLIDEQQYRDAYPNCTPAAADINLDGSVDFSDIDGFVDCLVKGGCP